ncbi:MAG: hypothetical protein R2852_02695 [Bacteroidia bacterium]
MSKQELYNYDSSIIQDTNLYLFWRSDSYYTEQDYKYVKVKSFIIKAKVMPMWSYQI